VWDAAHDVLAGDDPKVTLELAGDRLGIVNLKNVTYIPTEPGADVGGAWKPWFVQGADGLANWSSVFATLEALGWNGPICLTGQYSDPSVPVGDRLQIDLQAAQAAAR
jgi:sugar phosphate isomerase/epimerase